LSLQLSPQLSVSSLHNMMTDEWILYTTDFTEIFLAPWLECVKGRMKWDYRFITGNQNTRINCQNIYEEQFVSWLARAYNGR